jgi:hypothetical protein
MKKEQKKTAKEAEETVHVSAHSPIKKQVIASVAVAFMIIVATIIVILYGRGYRLFVQHGEPKVSKTGILNVNSTPIGAQVLVDNHPTILTNNDISLLPNKYNVKITKDGYMDWQKDIEIKKEVVSNIDATLFLKAPNLQSISTLGIQSAIIDPTNTKLAFNISSDSAKKNGIYVYDMSSHNFSILSSQNNTTHIADDTTDKFSEAQITWSPDGKQLIASISATTEITSVSYYLLTTDGANQTPQDITATYQNTLDLWKQQQQVQEVTKMKTLKPTLQKFAKENFKIIAWSPDNAHVLYQASASATMPIYIKPRLIGNNNLYEQRQLEQGSLYIYNIQEDFNTRMLEKKESQCTDEEQTCSIPLTWFPDSSHLLYVRDKKIYAIESDGSNRTLLYAGPFVDNYVFPWTDGSKLVILTNFNNPNTTPTLYSVGIK